MTVCALYLCILCICISVIVHSIAASPICRVNPSAGNLHPIEAHLVLPPLGPSVAGGQPLVAHYAPKWVKQQASHIKATRHEMWAVPMFLVVI